MGTLTPYSTPISEKKLIKRSEPQNAGNDNKRQKTKPNQLSGIYQPNGFPTRSAPVKPWVPGLSTPTTRPTLVLPDASNEKYESKDLIWNNPRSHIPEKKLKQTYSFLVTSTLSSVILAIPGVCWLIASKIGYL